MRRDIRAQEREIRSCSGPALDGLRGAPAVTLRAKLEDLCREREALRETQRTQLVEAIRRHHAAFALGSDSAVSIARI
jgi:hypothetical protein